MTKKKRSPMKQSSSPNPRPKKNRQTAVDAFFDVKPSAQKSISDAMVTNLFGTPSQEPDKNPYEPLQDPDDEEVETEEERDYASAIMSDSSYESAHEDSQITTPSANRKSNFSDTSKADESVDSIETARLDEIIAEAKRHEAEHERESEANRKIRKQQVGKPVQNSENSEGQPIRIGIQVPLEPTIAKIPTGPTKAFNSNVNVEINPRNKLPIRHPPLWNRLRSPKPFLLRKLPRAWKSIHSSRNAHPIPKRWKQK
jgi:hypothetical protein